MDLWWAGFNPGEQRNMATVQVGEDHGGMVCYEGHVFYWTHQGETEIVEKFTISTKKARPRPKSAGVQPRPEVVYVRRSSMLTPVPREIPRAWSRLPRS